MEQAGKHRRLHAPSPSMIVAIIALVFAMRGTAVAASHLVNGDSMIFTSAQGEQKGRFKRIAEGAKDPDCPAPPKRMQASA